MAQSGSRAGDDDLTFVLARTLQLVRKAAPAGGASLTRQNRARRGLAEAHARVQRAQSERAKYRHMSAPGADAELRAALEAFHTIAATALGLPEPLVDEEPGE
jgi:hypothetical protein